MLVRCGLVLKTCPRKRRSLSKGRYPRPIGGLRSNARAHPLSTLLAFLRAVALELMPTPLLHLPAHVGCPIRNALLTQSLVNPTGS